MRASASPASWRRPAPPAIPPRLGTKLAVRERLALLLDPGSFCEDGVLASACDERLRADGVLTGTGTIDDRSVAVIAHDPSVKAGSWGRRTVEKQIRILELADRDLLPVVFLVDSAGGRLTDALGFHPGPRGAARIFHLQVRLSGRVPQVCCLFGPSAAGGAYMPAFCDWVGMVEGNASMFLASPRIAAKATGEIVTLEGDGRSPDALHGVRLRRRPVRRRRRRDRGRPRRAALPARPPRRAARTHGTAATGVDPLGRRAARQSPIGLRHPRGHPAGRRRGPSLLEIKALWAAEMLVGFARIDGRAVGLVANQPKVRSGAIHVDSADKAARFISLCDAFNLPLVFLADLPGFMIGARVERAGIIRHGAKMIAAMSSAEVPRFLRGPAQGLRRRLLRDVLARLRAACDDRARGRADRGDGRRGRRERGLVQQDRGARGRAGARGRSSASAEPRSRRSWTRSASPPSS